MRRMVAVVLGVLVAAVLAQGALASSDGKTWESIESQTVPLIDLRVGIGACSPDAKDSTSAAFDFVRFSPLQ